MYNFKHILLFFALVSGSCIVQNDGLKAGDPLPNLVISITNYYDDPGNKISFYDYKNNESLLIAVMPDISVSNPSAKNNHNRLGRLFYRRIIIQVFRKIQV